MPELSAEDLAAVRLPKWSGLLVVGDPTTRNQAAEILLRPRESTPHVNSRLSRRVADRYAASLSDNPEKWQLKTRAFDPARYSRTKVIRGFVLHWRPIPRDPGFFEMDVTLADEPRVVASLFYGPWQTTDRTALEGAVEVDPGFRRQGLASALYDWAEQLTGLRFKPAPEHTEAAAAFWKHRRGLR